MARPHGKSPSNCGSISVERNVNPYQQHITITLLLPRMAFPVLHHSAWLDKKSLTFRYSLSIFYVYCNTSIACVDFTVWHNIGIIHVRKEMIPNDFKSFKMIPNDFKWFKMIQNDLKRFQIMSNDSKWFKMTQNDFYWLKVHLFERNLLKCLSFPEIISSFTGKPFRTK